MEGASTWKAPLDALVSQAMRSPQTRKAAEVQRCSTLLAQANLVCSIFPHPTCQPLQPSLNYPIRPKAYFTVCQNLSFTPSSPTYGKSVLQNPIQNSLSCFRCGRVCKPSLMPHRLVPQHSGFLHVLSLSEWVLGERKWHCL